MERIAPDEPITRKNPLAHVNKIRECNSFQMSNKAASQTIRTLMQNDLNKVERPENLESALAQKLQKHLTVESLSQT